MRIRRLHLEAFGPFTDVTLDLAASGPAVHVIHGRNEAGKSTALRALGGLLYGIPRDTPDGHVHALPKLRVGAIIERGDGSPIEVVRRKGNKNTLLDPKGVALDEAVLRSVLGGVGRELFDTLFGLNHETLRTGGNALLEGKGDVGESLFDAGVGGRGIHHVLERLEREAEELFAPRASTRKLNQAIGDYKEAKRQVSHQALSSSAWEAQQQEIGRTREERSALDERLGALLREQNRVGRHVRVIPKLELRRSLLDRRAEIGEVPRLPEDAAARRLDAQRTIEGCERAEKELVQDIARLEEKRAELDIPPSLEALSEAVVESLAERMAAHRKAASDLPRRQAELRAAEEDALAILRRLGREPSLDAVEGLRLGSDRLARIQALAGRHSGLEEGLRAAREALEERSLQLDEVAARLARLGPARDTGALAHAVAAARRLGDVDERLRQAEHARNRAAAAAQVKLEALGAWTGSLDELVRAPLPPAETIDRIATTMAELSGRRGQLEERLSGLLERSRDRTRELEALQAAGEVPSEAQLTEARTDRDRQWKRIRGGADAAGPEGDAFEASVTSADLVADRLRREAERVTQRARLEAELGALGREREALKGELEALATRDREVASEWRLLFGRAGVADPLPPIEMRAWLGRVEEIRRLAEAERTASAERDELASRIAAHDAAVRRELGGQDDDAREALPDGDPLGPLLDRATGILDEARRRAEERRALDERRAGLEQEVRSLERRLQQRSDELAAWRRDWAESTAGIGVRQGASVEEVSQVLGDLAELFRKSDQATELRRRIGAMRQDSEQLDGDAAEIVARHLPELGSLSLEERVGELVRRHRLLRRHVDQRRHIDEDLQERRSALEVRRRERAEAEGQLGELIRVAGVGDLAALLEVEERVEAARSIERKLRETEEQLVELGDGWSVEELIADTREVDLLEAKKRNAIIDDEIETVKEELGDAIRKLGRDEAGLESLRQRSAAEAADDAQAQLALIRDLGRRYARTRLAAAILRREIERYRERNQGPILSRANELFPRLTLGRYAELKAGFGEADQAVLRCVRADGTEVGIDGLSDGTRDQLYLALRLASLERHAEHDEPLPFILDDVLVHFDDDRARAALAALGELARTTQVLFFTHHARLVELAREAVPAGVLREHDLDAARAEAMGPLLRA